MIFPFSTTISLSDTDASGYLFYGALFRLSQSCFEAFLKSLDLPIERWLLGTLPALPVRSVSAEYLTPLRVGMEVILTIESVQPGSSSLKLWLSFTKHGSETPSATVQVTHVAVDPNTGTPVPLPEELLQALRRRSV